MNIIDLTVKLLELVFIKQRLLSVMLILIITTFSLRADEPITLYKNGKALTCIVVDKKFELWTEALAVRELIDYLKKITGVDFKVVKAGNEKEMDSCIYVNRVAARKLGINLAKLDSQAFVIQTRGNDIFITGGKRDGYLYGVYYFLENILGVRWWNKTEEFIPEKNKLVVSSCNIKKTPSFTLRASHRMHKLPSMKFYYDYYYNQTFDGKVRKIKNYRDRSRPENHNLIRFYVKEELFKTHPEWFAEIKGKRTLAAHDLCLTNPAVTKYIAGQIMKKIAYDRVASQKLATSAPFIYSVGREDNARWCECPSCKKYAKQHRKSGLLFNFINNIAKEVKDKYPEVIISSLAYQGSAKPPIDLVIADNVAPVYCFEKRNMARPLTDKSNKKALDELKGWAAISKNLFIWDYMKSFASFHKGKYEYDFPTPSMMHLATDYKLCKQLGVNGVFVQNSYNELNDLWGLKNWMLAKLYFDTSLDNEILMQTYLKGYYGAAWKNIRAYIKLLYDAEQRKPSRIWFYADLAEYKYFDLEFFLDAENIFEQAELSVVDNPLFLNRVKAARVSLDRTLIYVYSELRRQWDLQPGADLKEFPFKPSTVLARLKNNYMIKDKINVFNRRAKRYPDFIKKTLPELIKLTYYKHLPIPEKFKKIPPEKLYDYPAGSINLELGKGSTLINDVSVPGGKTIKIFCDIANFPFVWKFKPKWGAEQYEFSPGSNKRKEISIKAVKGEGYHWYRLGTYSFDGHATGLVFFDNNNLRFWADRIGKYDVWGYLKFESPTLKFCDKNAKPTVYLSRIILTPVRL